MSMFDKPILVFQTDFTYAEGAVSSMYGVVKTVDRELEIFDGTHQIPQYDTWSASYRLYQSLQFWPKGTIYVSVVDPGVGTARKACVAKTVDGYYIVTPDNGALTHIKKYVGIEAVRETDETVNRLQSTRGVAIFHGRDLFGYTAARLASGIIDFEGVGPEYPVEEIVEHPIYGQITGPLELSSRYDVSQFLLRSAETQPLSILTEGIHLHTLSCPDEAAFIRVQNALRDLGVLLEE